jgi:hypothetical protein
VGAITNRPTPREVNDVTTSYSRADAEARMFTELDPSLRAWALERITPHPVAALEAPMPPTTFWDRQWSASVIRCTQAANPPEAHQRRTAEKLGASYHELDTGHYPMLSAPDDLTKLLLG